MSFFDDDALDLAIGIFAVAVASLAFLSFFVVFL